MTQRLSHHGIGASEISTIAGLNPYASPWSVWLRKTGQAVDEPENAPMEWGHRLEPAIRQKYADDTDAFIRIPDASMYHSELSWARATPDGIVVNVQAGTGAMRWSHLLQCKNVGYWVEKAWSAAPPVYVQLQEQWELFVTGLHRADVAVLIGGSDYRCFTVHRDQKMINDLVDIATDFWRKVETLTEPDIDGSDACKEHFQRRLAKNSNIEVKADAELDEMFEQWKVIADEQRALKREAGRIRNAVRKVLADAQAGAVVSSVGTARLRTSGAEQTTRINWNMVAAKLAFLGSLPDHVVADVVADFTAVETTPEKTTLYAPTEWAKENV